MVLSFLERFGVLFGRVGRWSLACWEALWREPLAGVALFLMVSVGGGLAPGGTACGQERMGGAKPRQAPGGALPSWAEPSTGGRPSVGERPGMERRSGTRPRRLEPSMETKGFNPGEPVPLGGLEWLILAGAGYGLFRLRKKQ